ncbi:DUF6970 domain-containing protein [Hymenobacter glacieicola]|uniref:DUF6970 domain-containing protein n=1 Tax=Hymenobacter glacieicola TaxID=1562124 RepID=A0ABQ1WNF9_9BACT|nr:hypothetical protein [Hymenobacter glacieicola]GGG39326.1 hypothetical protein GCM10011378_14530 [Hymenobacter glacieicola]
MRSSLLLIPTLAVLLHSAGCQRNVAVTTPTDAPQTGLAGSVSTPAPTSANTIEPTPRPDAVFDATKRPKWLADRIQQHSNAEKQNPPIHIYSYQLDGATVYYESSPCCDQFTNLYAADGKLLCHPDGGLTGKGDGKCPDFVKNRTEERLVWQDPR